MQPKQKRLLFLILCFSFAFSGMLCEKIPEKIVELEQTFLVPLSLENLLKNENIQPGSKVPKGWNKKIFFEVPNPYDLTKNDFLAESKEKIREVVVDSFQVLVLENSSLIVPPALELFHSTDAEIGTKISTIPAGYAIEKKVNVVWEPKELQNFQEKMKILKGKITFKGAIVLEEGMEVPSGKILVQVQVRLAYVLGI